MKLKELVDESLIRDGFGRERKNDFKKEKNTSQFKLVKELNKPSGCKLYRYRDRFYVVSPHDDYLGHIEFDEKSIDGRNCIFITETYSEKNNRWKIPGFYKVIFGLILAHTDIKYIFNSEIESNASVKSWKRMIKSSSLKFASFNVETKKILSYDPEKEDEYWTKSDDLELWKKYLIGATLYNITMTESSHQFHWDIDVMCDEIFKRYIKNGREPYSEKNIRNMEGMFYGVLEEDYQEPLTDETDITHDYLREVYNHGSRY